MLNIKILCFLCWRIDGFFALFFPVYLSFCSRSISPPRDRGLNWAILSESSRDSNQFEFWHLEIDGRENNTGKNISRDEIVCLKPSTQKTAFVLAKEKALLKVTENKYSLETIITSPVEKALSFLEYFTIRQLFVYLLK